MLKTYNAIVLLSSAFLLFSSTVLYASSEITAQDTPAKQAATPRNIRETFHAVPYSPGQDMAIVSVMGSRPKGSFKGFHRALIFNARGVVLQEIEIGRNDSIYSIDKIIEQNRTKGPLFIKMIR